MLVANAAGDGALQTDTKNDEKNKVRFQETLCEKSSFEAVNLFGSLLPETILLSPTHTDMQLLYRTGLKEVWMKAHSNRSGRVSFLDRRTIPSCF